MFMLNLIKRFFKFLNPSDKSVPGPSWLMLILIVIGLYVVYSLSTPIMTKLGFDTKDHLKDVVATQQDTIDNVVSTNESLVVEIEKGNDSSNITLDILDNMHLDKKSIDEEFDKKEKEIQDKLDKVKKDSPPVSKTTTHKPKKSTKPSKRTQVVSEIVITSIWDSYCDATDFSCVN